MEKQVKEKEIKLSFKKEPAEKGLARVGNPHSSVNIKIDKKLVGLISAPNWQSPDNLWRVRFMIEEENSFEWITLKATFENEEKAREFLKANIKDIMARYKLYFLSDY